MNDDRERGDEQPTAPALPDTIDLPNACVACWYWGGPRFNPPGLDWASPVPPLRLWNTGRCRRYPPKVLAETDSPDGDAISISAYTRWPTPMGGDWCGEFEPTDGRDIVEQIAKVTAHLRTGGTREQ
jgi:hypothetical protein